LDTLQQGFETEIDSAGKKLPSTIVKKILLLRAFANQPNLLLLEEPWQGLEEAEKEKMVNHLLNMIPNTTIIVVSNDEVFAQKCDYHFHLENGKIV
jgi:ATP-binding cassette, subfamily B, bacterial